VASGCCGRRTFRHGRAFSSQRSQKRSSGLSSRHLRW
jgi:hypothetical protein